MYSPKRRLRLFRHPAWAGGAPSPPAGSSTDIYAFAQSLATTFTGYSVTPTDGGALTINSQAVGNYEYTTRNGDTTISSFTASDWFTNTKDTTSSWIVVNGNLTINSGQTLIPPVRKLFTVLYVTGNLTVNGSISMTARGANHSGTGNSGGATTAVPIRIATGTFSAVTNPQIPATGGAGATSRSTAGANPGSAGTNGGTGGGAGGEWFNNGGAVGAGAAGTCFSGGAGSGSVYRNSAGAGSAAGGANGGAGSDGSSDGGTFGSGGSGNPGGTGYYFNVVDNRFAGGTGTGGVIIVICGGALSGSGTIVANGSASSTLSGSGGGGSGGGSINVLYKTNPGSAVTLTANGGSSGGGGGNGTARKLAIP
jgi:hypothetical protein